MTETVDQTDIWPYDCHPQSKFAKKSGTKYSTASLTTWNFITVQSNR